MSIKGSAQPPEIDMSLQSIGLVQSLVELVKNPKGVEDLKRNLIEASTISKERKQEAAEATAVITQAEQATNRLETATAAHQAKVDSFTKKVVEHQTLHTEAMEKLEKEKLRSKAESDARMAEAKRLGEEAESRHRQANARDIQHAERETALASAQALLKQEQDALARERKLYADAVTKFNARKKTLAAAAREAAEGD